jgi:hypothetical protein
MLGLIMILAALAVGALSAVAGVDSRDGPTDGRGAPTPTMGLS